MSEYVEIHWTSGNLEEARKISRYLVQERLVACAQIIPWIESIYMWNNRLDTNQESKIIFKTRRDRFDAIKKVIEQNSQYAIPEITCVAIIEGNQNYLDWIKENTPDFAAQ